MRELCACMRWRACSPYCRGGYKAGPHSVREVCARMRWRACSLHSRGYEAGSHEHKGCRQKGQTRRRAMCTWASLQATWKWLALMTTRRPTSPYPGRRGRISVPTVS